MFRMSSEEENDQVLRRDDSIPSRQRLISERSDYEPEEGAPVQRLYGQGR